MTAAFLNAERATATMRGRGLDALVATTRPNFVYAAQYLRGLPFATGSRVAAIVAGDPAQLVALVLPRIEVPAVEEYLRSRDSDVVVELYGEFFVTAAPDAVLTERDTAAYRRLSQAERHPDFFHALERVLGRLGLTGGTIAWDDLAEDADRDFAASVGVVARGGRETWRHIRRIKSEAEVERLGRSAALTEHVERDLMSRLVPGADWLDLHQSHLLSFVAGGGVPGFWSSGSGEDAGVICTPRSRILREGDLVRFDFGCTVDNYWSDTGRTAVLGEPTPLAARRYAALRAGMDEGLAAVKAGTRISDLFDLVMSTIHAHGFPEYQRHHVGHSIGIEMYDADFITPVNSGFLEEDMVINLEVPYYELGWGGLQIEDTMRVRADGTELLTSCSRDLSIVT